jgi:hypothetical protein
MEITEKDIFYYVFFRDKLPEEKTEFIEESRLFEDEKNFYLSLRESLRDKVEKRVFRLRPVLLDFKRYSSNVPRYAAASADLTRKTEFTTFTDENSGYLCRLLKSDDKNLLYIISADEITDKKLNVILYPSENRYHLADLNQPIEIPDVEVSLIHLEEE